MIPDEIGRRIVQQFDQMVATAASVLRRELIDDFGEDGDRVLFVTRPEYANPAFPRLEAMVERHTGSRPDGAQWNGWFGVVAPLDLYHRAINETFGQRLDVEYSTLVPAQLKELAHTRPAVVLLADAVVLVTERQDER